MVEQYESQEWTGPELRRFQCEARIGQSRGHDDDVASADLQELLQV